MQVKINPLEQFTDEQLFAFCLANPDLRIERNAKGQLLIMTPTGLDTSFHNSNLVLELGLWNRQYKLGKVSDSNGGYTLKNGAMYAPDAAWISHLRLDQVDPAERKRFARVCPNFVIELLSESDSLKQTQEKMEEWLSQGVQLAWLIDPKKQIVYIYQENGERKSQAFSEVLTGEDILPHFSLQLDELLAG